MLKRLFAGLISVISEIIRIIRISLVVLIGPFWQTGDCV